MPSQDDLINANREAMRLRAEARASGGAPIREVPLSRSQMRRRIGVMQAEIDRLRDIPADAERLQSELTSVRAAHMAVIGERDALEGQLKTAREERDQARSDLTAAREERDQARSDLATVRKSLVPAAP